MAVRLRQSSERPAAGRGNPAKEIYFRFMSAQMASARRSPHEQALLVVGAGGEQQAELD
jgi:hypothetical protein